MFPLKGVARAAGRAAALAAGVGMVSSPVDRRQLAVETLQQELENLDNELKEWFLTRKVALERHRALHALLLRHNFVGLSVNNEKLPDAQRALWTDLVVGEPKLEDALSVDAREMKADMYLKMFREAADLENPACVPGVAYLRCLKEHRMESHARRSEQCRTLFETFDDARKELLLQQANATERAMVQQNVADLRAKALFERRLQILSFIDAANS